MAGALFGVALDAKESMRQELFQKFTIRTGTLGGRKPWAERAMFVQPEKTSMIRDQIKTTGQASITIGSRSKVVGKMLTTGGIRKLPDRDIAVPILGGGRKNKGTIITPSRITKTGKLRKGNDAYSVMGNKGFTLPLKNGNGRLLLIRTQKWKRGADDRANLKSMFYMKQQVVMKPWWNLHDILTKALETNLPRRFLEAYQKAMETRKPR